MASISSALRTLDDALTRAGGSSAKLARPSDEGPANGGGRLPSPHASWWRVADRVIGIPPKYIEVLGLQEPPGTALLAQPPELPDRVNIVLADIGQPFLGLGTDVAHGYLLEPTISDQVADGRSFRVHKHAAQVIDMAAPQRPPAPAPIQVEQAHSPGQQPGLAVCFPVNLRSALRRRPERRLGLLLRARQLKRAVVLSHG